MDSLFKIDVIFTNFPRGISTSNRWRIDVDVSIGIGPHIGLYNWEGTEFPAGIKDWNRFDRNNKTIALNILFVPHNEKIINLAYKSKYNPKRENQAVLLMITNGEKWHYIA